MYQRLPAPPLKPSNHPFSSPCSKPQPENDVFLNFRGEDTRNNFTDHLYRALEGKRIKTFKDDTELEAGYPVSLKLLETIEKSRIAVVILSKNYASSTWCLEELVKILKCMKEGGLTVLPIFYHVDPSHVRNQREIFAVAFAEHECRFQRKQVQIWRNALRDVAELSGKTLTNGPEGEFIQEIVDWIFARLKDKRSIVYEDGFVGMGSRVEEMNSFLDMNSNDVRFIGICGKSGMGKTTLARLVFDKICNQFEACSFLENVQEVSKARGLETLQEQLLCDISKGALRVRDVSRGIQVIRNILCDKKLLIVVDDASEKRHLEALAGKSWFGPRSRIIVTTEEERLLKSYEIQTVCKADGLNNEEAQRLFSHKAHCEIDFLDLVNNFVTYAQGSPLVLNVLGSHLCKRTIEEWESAHNQLKAIPKENVPEKLQIAYNGLEELEKKLFLHIACFFKGEDQNRVAAVLESVCYWDDNIRKLIEKSLITIVGGKLCMHHLIQQMGWKIVCGESMDLGRRSRLWDCTDVLYVLKNNIGTDQIEGIVLNLPPNEEQEELNAEPFSKMNNLKLLKLCKLHLHCLGNLSNELLLLEWHEYPLKSLPKSFQPPELVELIMHNSGIKQLASEFSNLHKLKLIDLSDSQNLCQTPNFNGLPNIERLIFQGCTGLRVLHPSVGSLKRLILLNLKDCKCLENLPHKINLESLKILILSGCSKLKKFPMIGRNMTSMLELYLDRTAVEELPLSMQRLTGLTLLNLQDCKNLSSFPSVICSLISLKSLILSGCNGQSLKASYFLGLIPTLSSIGITLTLPYTYLTDRQPEPELISLVLPKSFSGLSSLESLDLSGCNMLDGALPDELSYLSSLTSLNLRNNNFTRLPYSISQLLNLKLLFLDHCSKLQSLPYFPLSTQFVSAQGCTSLENYSNQVVVWSLGETVFTFINCLDLADDEEGKIVDVSLQDIHFQALWQRYIEDQINQIEGFCLVLPQTEIPECFKNKECGPSVRIPLPSNLFNNRSWKGIALCVIFVVPKNLEDVSPGQDSKYFHEFICHFDIDGDLLNCPLVAKVPKETYVGSFGLWLYVSHARFTAHLDEGSCISSLIRPKRMDIQIKMCGAFILYDQDMVEFVQNLRQKNFGSCNDLSQGHEKFIEDHMSNSQSRKLKSLLSRLYQVDWAQNHLYDYIFHQIAHPPCWFTCKNLGPYIELQLPPGVHDNSKWLGFTIYALYGIQMQRAGFSYKLDSTVFLSHYSLSASDEVSFAPYTSFSLFGDVFVESSQDSQRLVVFYIPRRVFQLNRCNHIEALFKSGDPGVQVEMCDIRLVYEQDVQEFVQALVEYMLGSPDANHQSFSEHLSHQLGMLQGCNHENHDLCPFIPESRPKPMPKLLQEECTLWETFPNQVIAAGTSKNSSPGSINLGISFGNGQKNFGSCNDLSRGHEKFIEDHMSNSQSRKLKSLLSRLYQVDWAQNHLYDYIFHQIARPPRWFTCKNLGPYIELQLPPGVHDDSKWLGFTIYALYGIQMQRAGFSYKLDSTIFLSHYSLSASDEVSFAPYTSFSLFGDVFVESSQDSQRLVVFYIPRRVFQLNRCNHIEALFKSGDPGVQVEMCDIRLVYEQDVQEFVQALVEYMLGSPDANHQSLSEHLSHQLGMLQGCNHENHDLCPFLPESRPKPMPKLLQEECTLRETFPNQVIAAGTSKNSSPGSINLGISFGNGQCGSNMSGSLECWFKPYLQYLDKLKHIDLSHSQNLIHTPDFIGVPNIQTLIFQGCTRLRELHPSVGGLKQFNQLNRKDCKRLENLPLELNLDGLQPIEAFLCSYQVTPEPVPVNLLLPMAFSGLRTLVSLDLSDCNLLDGALPDLSYLCSLKFLKLSKNNFTYLPDSISELSKLKILFLDHCAQLKSFPYLPLSTQFVSARGCILLENYSNQVVVWTSGEAGFTIIDFLGLTVDEGGKITELFFLDIQHQLLWQRFIEKQIEGIYGDFEVQSVPRLTDQSETNKTKTQLGITDLLALDFDLCQVYNSCFPLCEIPEWFNHWSEEPQLTIPLPPNVYNDSTWMGLALFASVAVEANQTTILDIQNSETSYSLVCHLETSIDCVEPVHVHHITKEDLMLLQQGGFIWLSYIPRDSFKESLNQCSRIEASITINCPGLVQKCGFHLLYKHDEVEFKETRQYATVVSNEQEVSAKISSSSNEDPQSEPVEPANWKDKGKCVRVLASIVLLILFLWGLSLFSYW